ncbi:restriction endonuclease subunit S [Candidatus Dependentiae bacterium]|nr:restriction endonuclease subunit S [Candidatus Dependentiae bacterium]
MKIKKIPVGWEEKKIDELNISIIDGDRGKNYPNEKDFYDNEFCLFLTAKNVTINGFKFYECQYITKEKDSKLNNGKLQKNDIVLTTRGTIGNFAYYNESITYENIRINSGMVIIRNKEKLFTNYLYFFLRSFIIKSQIKKVVFGSAQAQLTVQIIKTLKILYPKNLIEQQKIAEILSTWDEGIEKIEKLIESKQKLKKGIMQKIFSVKSEKLRVKSFNIKMQKLKNYIKEISIKNRGSKISTVLSVTNSNGFINQEDQFERKVASKDLSNYKIVKKGQFAYNPSRINVGSIDLLESFEEGIVSPIYVAFETKEEELSKYYFKYFLQTNLFKQQMKKYFAGSVRESLTFSGLSFIKIPLADINKQKYYVNILLTIDKEIDLLNKQLSLFNNQKKGLMQVLLTGNIRVKI